jgi:AraC-like DNA-binding protein
MLIARGHKQVGLGDLRWALVFAPGFWSVVVERAGLVLDTRFIPAAIDPARPRSCLYLLLEGTWVVHRTDGEEAMRLVAPSVFVVTEEQLEGAAGARSMTFTAHGTPFRAIEIHVEQSDLSALPGALPARLDVDDAVVSAAEKVARLTPHDDGSLETSFGSLLHDLAERSLLDRRVADIVRRPVSKPFALLWGALRPMIERLYLNPTLQEVGEASQLSTRQLDRYVQRFVTTFGLIGERWRTTTLHIRLKLAIILLSADGASIAEVASAVGYGSSDAMARMFRDAGLPAPAIVQQRVRAARGVDA